MAVLTWRNVDAPSFRDSADGIRVAGTMFDRAAGNLSQGLGQFQDWRQNQTAGALLNNAQGFTDPEELRKAIASGAVFNGVDRGLVTPQALAALNSQTGTLLDQGVTAEGLRFSKEANPLKITNTKLINDGLVIKNDHDVLMNPLLRANTSAGTANTQAQTAQTLQTTAQNAKLFPLKFRGVELDNDSKKANIDQTIQTTQFKSDLHPFDFAKQQLDLDKGNFGFKNDQTAFADKNAATAFAVKTNLESMTAPDAMMHISSPAFKALSAGAQSLVLGALATRFPDLLGAAGVSGVPASMGNGAPGSAPTPTGSFADTMITRAAKRDDTPASAFANAILIPETKKYVTNISKQVGDLSGLTIDEKVEKLTPYVVNSESGGDPNAVSPKGAAGYMQIMPSTFAEVAKRHGISGSIMNKDVNTAVGKAYLKELLIKYEGDHERALAGYNMGPNKLDKWLGDANDPNSVDAKIRAEANKSGLAIDIAQKSIGERNAQNNNSLIAKAETSLFDTKTDLIGGIDRLKKNQFYAGTPLAILKASMEKLMSMKGKDGKGSINAATAADILEESVNAPNKFERNTFGLLNYSTPDDDAAEKKAKMYLQGDVADAVKRNLLVKNVSDKLTAAKSSLENASAQYSAALKREGLPPEVLARYRAQVVMAQKAVNGILEVQQGDFNQPTDTSVNMFRPVYSKPGDVSPPPRLPPPDVRWRGTIPKIPVE
jgi:hypothetical protein